MCEFLLVEYERLLCELSPGSLLFNFFVGQAVIVRSDVGLKLS